MKSITKIRVVLVLIIIALVLSISNINSNQILYEKCSNSLNVNTKRISVDQIEIKSGGDNSYKKVWDSGTAMGWIYDLCTDDLDMDGKKEIIVSDSDHLLVLEYNETYNNYTIVWDSGETFSTWNRVCTGDYDGDGMKEIIAGGTMDQLYIYEYSGTDNTYAKVNQINQIGSIQDVTMGDDCDKDGNDELIITRNWAFGATVKVYEFNGTEDGWEETWQSVDMDATEMVCSSDDLDGDASKEIITSSGSNLIVFENTANNTFIKVWNSSNKIPSFIEYIHVGGDLDDDGKKEIFAGTNGDKLYVFEYNGTVDNGYNKTWDSKSIIGGRVMSICISDDLDGDGKKELIAGSDSADGKIYIFEYNGTDNGLTKVWDSGTTTSNLISSIRIGDDLDRNGKKEIIASSFNGKVYVFEYDDTTRSQSIIIIDEDDDDDDDDDEDGIFISNQTLLIGGAISAVVLVAVIIIIIKKKTGSGR